MLIRVVRLWPLFPAKDLTYIWCIDRLKRAGIRIYIYQRSETIIDHAERRISHEILASTIDVVCVVVEMRVIGAKAPPAGE